MELNKYPKWFILVRITRFLITKFIPHRLLYRVNARADTLMLSMSTKKRHGVWTLYCINAKQSDEFFSMCESALTLLFHSDPRRYQRMRSLIRNIVLTPLGQDCFDHISWSILINNYDPARPDLLAITFVHESTHAYLRSKGLCHNDNPRRHEEICLKEEFRSIKRIMTASSAFTEDQRIEALQQWQDYFKAAMESEWWKPEKRDLVIADALRNLHKRID